MFKNLLKIIVLVLTVFSIWNCKSIIYGVHQGKGQLRIVRNAEPIDFFLLDSSYPDSLKSKIKLIQEIKQFAFDSLGINYSDNYKKMFDQKGKPVMHVVTGCKPYALEPYLWSFPIAGEFSYKGFFDKDKAEKEARKLNERGWDTDVGVIYAWSTLGWFEDPIMSSMLEKSPGQLARVIIHELTHGTLYIKNNVSFNENLASFVGDRGAILFLKHKYGLKSKELIDYQGDFSDMKKIKDHLLLGAKELDLFYKTTKDSVTLKNNKRVVINKIIQSMDTISLYNKGKLDHLIAKADSINNTFFTDFLTYKSEQNILEAQFKSEFNSNFKNYLNFLKAEYPSM